MKARTTITLFLLVSMLGFYIALVERKAETTEQREKMARRALRLEAAKVKQFSFVTEDLQVICEKTGEEWRLISPVKARADRGVIDTILFNLENLPKGEVITEKERKRKNLTLKDYGLEHPRATISFVTDEGKTTLLVGRDAPLGGYIYVKEESQPDIAVAETNFLSGFPKNITELRDRNLFTGYPANVTRVDVRRKDGFVQLIKTKQGTWMIQKPLVARAAQASIQDILDKLYDVRVEEFVADSFAASSLYGLDEPIAQITLSGDDKSEDQLLMLGKPVEKLPGYLYATLQGTEAVYAISDAILDTLKFRLEDLRDRRLLALSAYEIGYASIEEGERVLRLKKDADGHWSIVEPKQYKADEQRVQILLSEWTGARIDSFMDEPGTNLAGLGLSSPSRKLVFSKDEAGAQKLLAVGVETMWTPDLEEVGSVIFVGTFSTNDNTAVVKVSGEPAPYKISAEPLNAMLMEPLFYRDHEVLSLEPDAVRKMMVQQSDLQQVIEREGTNEFRAVSSSDSVDQNVVRGVLEMLQSLRAVDLVAEDPKNLAMYGLDAPSASLTLGLSGAAGIGKTILIGHDAGEEAVYAMVKGQDLVFTLSKGLRDKLLQPLYKSGQP